MAATITDKDNGLKALLARIKGAKKAAVTVGVHAAEGGTPHEDAPLSVAEIATIHEFGTGTIPQRSFIRAWADENATKNAEALAAVALSIVQGKFSLAQGLDRLGLRFVGSIQQRMAAGLSPALAPQTIARREHGGTKPLVDTGQLKSSIRHKAHLDGGGGEE